MILQSMLPRGLVAREARGDVDAQLHPREAAQIARAVPKRQAEYATVRQLAREALGELGIDDAVLVKGESGGVDWPRNVVGALTHCDGYRGAVVGYRMGVRTVGIDAEPHLPLPDKVLPTVSVASEREVLASREEDGLHWDRLLFCAKEATYKAWNPITGRWLGFEDAEIGFDLTSRTDDSAEGTFRSRILIDGRATDGGPPVASFAGRWRITGGLIVTSIAEV
ncbi:4'-phosphopantetheinyl transferase [Tsukamurella spumae]